MIPTRPKSDLSFKLIELLPVIWILALALLVQPRPLFAQIAASSAAAGSTGSLTLWTDPRTSQVFTRPGPGRVPLNLGVIAAPVQHSLENQIQKQQVATTKLTQQVTQQQVQTDAVVHQVNTMRPAWQNYVDSFQNKVSIGGQFWFAYQYFTHTGWGPQYLTQENWPGPGNNGFNSFFMHRGYINLFFYPTKDWTLRLTPNIYTMIGNTSAQAYGRSSAMPNANVGNLGYRIKYGYVQWNTPFLNLGMDSIKNDKIIVGVQPQPITAWEEDLYGYRFVNLTTWNMSLSSTFPGISVQGPITFGPEHLQYADYNVGVFDNASFHAIEATDTKDVMARLSIYPFGAKWRFDGLGFTSFYDFGYGNTTPDAADLPTALKGPNAEIERFAEIVHYTAETWGIAFEYDWGRNAWSPGNMFSASGPAAVFGLTPNLPAPLALNYAAYSNLANALLNNGRSYQQGFNFFGHYHIPNSRVTLFGWLEQWNPNTSVNTNPFDFYRVILGAAYQWNEYLRFAIDTQNTLFFHNQYNFPVSYAKSFGFTPPTGFTSGSIPNVVTRDTHVFMLNVEYVF
ncbi:MAG TPA: hypothetical protein VKV28_16735 [Candidatus Binataceae bacterium]|nr:hypothetical protein [Candidatus Binataceae bacterium]